MQDAFLVIVQGLDALPTGTEWSDEIDVAKVRAVNRTADWARTRSADEIRKQVNFPASYLKPGAGRLSVTKRASSANVEAIVTGRGRPTSLARFSRGGAINQPGVEIEVKPGRATFMRRAFLIRLRSGSADLETRSNLGLAVRLPKGEKLKNKRTAVQMKNGLYLLYGPSVDQVFDDVAEQVSEPAAEYLDREFRRLVKL